MKLLSYGLDHRMEPRLAFSLNGYAVDVMRASLWMKAERNALDYLSLPSSMRLALEDWPRTKSLLSELLTTFQSLELSTLKTHDRPVALLESDIAFFAPIPDPPSLRFFQAFKMPVDRRFDFGNTQTLLGHLQAAPFSGLIPLPEMAAIVANPRDGQTPEIAGYTIVNNSSDPEASPEDMGARKGVSTMMGPYLVTADELESHKMGLGFALDVVLKMNGIQAAHGRFKEMQISFHDMLNLAMRTRVQAGDVLCSGSPLSTPVSVEAKSRVEIEIQGLGKLSTPSGSIQS